MNTTFIDNGNGTITKRTTTVVDEPFDPTAVENLIAGLKENLDRDVQSAEANVEAVRKAGQDKIDALQADLDACQAAFPDGPNA